MEALMKQEVVGIPVVSAAFRPVEKSLKRLLPAPASGQSPDREPRATKQCREDSVVSRGNKVGSFAHGVREYVRLAQKIRETVKGKLSLGAKIILQVGGLRKVYKQLFSVREGEKLLKACQCHLSTTAGPIAGLLFISTHKLAFCSDRSIKLSSPTGELRFHYKVVIPVGKIERVNQSENVKKPSQKYLEIVTVDNFDFWFMGFLNFQKTFRFLQQALSQEWKINC